MSDPAKSPEEIEDVLASIRRLVASHPPEPDVETAPGSPHGAGDVAGDQDAVADGGDAPGADADTAAPERLILTSSYRVPDALPAKADLSDAGPINPGASLDQGKGEPTDASPMAPASPTDPISDPISDKSADISADKGPDKSADDKSVGDLALGLETPWKAEQRLAEFDLIGELSLKSGDASGADLLDDAASAGTPMGDAPIDGPETQKPAEAATPIPTPSPNAEFESDTGDDDWPDDKAQAASLQLAALRDVTSPTKAVAALADASDLADTLAATTAPDDVETGTDPDRAEALETAPEATLPDHLHDGTDGDDEPLTSATKDATTDAQTDDDAAPDLMAALDLSDRDDEPDDHSAPEEDAKLNASDRATDAPQINKAETDGPVTPSETAPPDQTPDPMLASTTQHKSAPLETDDGTEEPAITPGAAPRKRPMTRPIFSRKGKAKADPVALAIASAIGVDSATSPASATETAPDPADITADAASDQDPAGRAETGPDAPDAPDAPEEVRADAELAKSLADVDMPNLLDGGVLDEDTLRDLIVEIVREELSGVLGQRLTRNVRKMVRREIRQALAAEDLD